MDHLEPEPGIFSLGSDPGYDFALRRALLPRRLLHIAVVVAPSFEPESALYARTERRQGRLLGVSRCACSLWSAKLDDGTFPAPPVDAVEVPLAEELFQALIALWDAALASVRPAPQHLMILDGVVHHFASPTASGRSHSPASGTACAALVAYVDALAEHVRGGPEPTPDPSEIRARFLRSN